MTIFYLKIPMMWNKPSPTCHQKNFHHYKFLNRKKNVVPENSEEDDDYDDNENGAVIEE